MILIASLYNNLLLFNDRDIIKGLKEIIKNALIFINKDILFYIRKQK